MVLLVALCLGVALSSCTAAPSKKLNDSSLTVGFLSEMQTVDPDVYYGAEGLIVTTAVYEGLLSYEPNPKNSPASWLPEDERLRPGLADSWEISEDALTYTFHLRDGVKFHDGTAADSAAWQASFERRTKVSQGPAYMLSQVESTATPDPLTFVVRLKAPVSPFLDYLASPYSPKAISPTAVSENTVSGDLAQEWLSTHDAGTGPYTVTEYVPNDHYVLEASPQYHGQSPDFKKITIKIVPDMQSQKVLLKNGQLDLITKGLTVQDIQSLRNDPNVTVTTFGLAINTGMFINPDGVFSTPELRKALREAVDRKSMVEPVFGDTATLATEFYPRATFPEGRAPDTPVNDSAALRDMVDSLPSKQVDIAYAEASGPPMGQLAGLLQIQLSAIGLEPKVRPISSALEYNLYAAPVEDRPDILVDLIGTDAENPDTVAEILFRTGAEPLNWFNYSIPDADKSMDLGVSASSESEATSHFADVARSVIDYGAVLSFVNNSDVIVARAGIDNMVHEPVALYSVRLADLRRVS